MHLAPFVLACGLAGTAAFGQAGREWPYYGGDQGQTKYSALTQINRENVGQLRPAWIYHGGDATDQSTLECTPIVVDGVVYLTTPGLNLVALDAATGRQKWRFDPGLHSLGWAVNRGVTYWSDGNDRRIFYAPGSYIYAINADTGQPVTEFGLAGRIDMRDGLDRDVHNLTVTATSPGVVYRDLFIIGSTVGEGPTPAAPGHIRAFDARTGRRRWIFHTIPHPGEPGYDTWPPDAWTRTGGTNCWGGMALDAQRGWIFAGTGSPTYDGYGGDRVGKNLFGNCVLVLKAQTGELVWHYQTIHHDLWDYDLPCPPTLVKVWRGGREVDAIAQSTKTGFLFLFDRQAGTPLFDVVERPVPASELPGERAWPTQPYPVKPRPFALQGWHAGDLTDLTPEAHAFAQRQFDEMGPSELFTPPGLRRKARLPETNGGGEWGGTAFDPATHLLYVNASNQLRQYQMFPSQSVQVTLPVLGLRLYETICSTCHGIEQNRPGVVVGGPSLLSVRDRLTRPQVLQILEKGRNQMPAFPTLTATEKRGLVAFLFGDPPGETVYQGELSFAKQIPYSGAGASYIYDADGYPLNKRPWGTLTAIDLDRGEIRWQVPLGTFPALEKKGYPPTGTFNIGGELVTAGGLVFIGAAMDERFHAFDKSTGKLLWEYQMSAGGYATPATFEAAGRQFVIIAAGGGGKPRTRSGDTYYCFAIPSP